MTMAERPVFIPSKTQTHFVDEILFSFTWNPGFAPIQKKRNVAAMHKAAELAGVSPLLEISTKSEEPLGQRLSAFSLKVEHTSRGTIPLESAYQGSKVFENGGPFVDLYDADPRAAKKDSRIRSSGKIKGFLYESFYFPSETMTAFYDWLYIKSLVSHLDFLDHLNYYYGFTDIEFNPARQLNCQARSCALLVSLKKRGNLAAALESPESFIEITAGYCVRDCDSRKQSGEEGFLYS